MKLVSVSIENFGIFTDRSFDFGQGGFQLVVGPNEAGKTTLLELIRQLLFGFPHRSPYVLEGHAGELAATAIVEMADGTRVRFRRRKGRNATLVGQLLDSSQTAIDEQRWTQMLRGAGSELYQHVFGFSLAELASGERSLEHANLREALFGGGIGSLARFQQVQRGLLADQKELYSPRGTKPSINRLLDTIRSQVSQLRDACVKPHDYEQLRQQVAACEADVDRLRARLESLRRLASHHDRLIRALPGWLELQEVRRSLELLKVPDGFPRSAAEEFAKLRTQMEETSAEVQRLVSEQQELALRNSRIRPAPALAAVAGEIRELYRDVGRIQSFRNDLPRRQHEAVGIQQEVLHRIRQINPQWDLNQLVQFPAGLAERERVQRLADQWRSCERRSAEWAGQLPEARRQFEAAAKRLAELQSEPFPTALEHLVEQAACYHASLEQLADLQSRRDALSAELKVHQQQLAAPLKQDHLDHASLVVPLPSTVRAFRDQLQEAEKTVDRASQLLDECQRELAERREDLRQLDALHPLPPRDLVEQHRRRRDQGWQLIRRKYLAGESVDSLIDAWRGDEGGELADQFEQLMALADQLADRRLELADKVARREQLSSAIQRYEARCQQAVAAHGAAANERARLDEQWREVWRECGFQPLAPDAMLDWLQIHSAALGKLRQLKQLEDASQRLQSTREEFESQLTRLLPDASGPPHQLLAEARRRVDNARQAASEQRQLERQLPPLLEKRDQLERQVAGVDQEMQQCQVRWRQTLDELGFPRSWDVQLTEKILTEINEARQRYREAELLNRRISDMQSEMADYEGRVRELCRSVAPDLQSTPAEEAMLDLERRLAAAIEAERAHQSLQEALGAGQQRNSAKQAKLERLRNQCQALLEAAGAASENEFVELAARAARQVELQDRERALARDLRIVRGTDDESRFFAELGEADEDSLVARFHQLTSEIKEVDASCQQAIRQAAVCRHRLEQMDNENRATQLAMQLEQTRAELSCAVDSWAPLVLAHALIQRSLERFEQRHQPAMLREVSRLLREMTSGRYLDVRRKLDERGTLLVRQHDGAEKEPWQLSTGTREQLYLAIRLAYISHYAGSAEPLPVVMDDVLVNFDHERTRNTLEVLSHFSQHVQVIYLTCHPSILTLANQLDQPPQIIELSAGQDVARLDSPSPPRRSRKPPKKPASPQSGVDSQGILF